MNLSNISKKILASLTLVTMMSVTLPVAAAEAVSTLLEQITAELPKVSYTVPEPRIRVGLYPTKYKTVEVRANKAFIVVNNKAETIDTVEADKIVKVTYVAKNKAYKIETGDQTLQSSELVRFEPISEDTVFELANWSNPALWVKGVNDNKYRGIIEVRYLPVYGNSYVINELYIEDYEKGIGEANNSYDEEFYKVLAVVTRSYALHYVFNEKKYPNSFYHVQNTTNDQLYRGYNSEIRSPKIVAGVNATKEQVVTYDGKLAVTPYFAQSSGKTYSYKAVWGQNRPWMVGTTDKYNKGLTLLGHGVGMSLMGAVYLVKYDDLTFEEVIKHYFKGVEIESVDQATNA